MRLFVYGTLMRGESAHDLLRGARFLGEVHTPPHFTLFDMGEYPALVPRGSTAVVGELYEVDESILLELDRYEEAPSVYQQATLVLNGGAAVTYVLAKIPPGRPALKHGDWRKR